MKLVKSLLLGSAAALVAGAGAQAADLPVRKAAPVEYVKVCDAYGAGFFYIPGTDTCVKIGGRVRADYAVSGKTSYYDRAFINTSLPGQPQTLRVADDSRAVNTYGWEARGRVDLDARTQTPYGTVQAVASIRLARTTGTLASISGRTADNLSGFSDSAANPTLEAAYIRFAGFTFGAARDNFSFMPSTFYGAGHWSSFANGAKQIAYTAVLGGGLSATVAIQDSTDTTANRGSATSNGTPNYTGLFGFTTVDAFHSYNNLPQINGRIDLDQGWGSASIMGAVGKAVAVNSAVGTSSSVDLDKTVWAIGAGLKINLPMLAAGDVLWLNAAYADGMTEYTTNWTYNKSSDTAQNVGGFRRNHASYVLGTDANGVVGIETLKSWNIAAVFTHYWTPEWRHSFLATYGQIDGTRSSRLATFNPVTASGISGGQGDATVWNIGTQIAWLPTRNFEIGVEALYARVEQDIRRANLATPGTGVPTSVVTREKAGNWTGRLRVERTF